MTSNVVIVETDEPDNSPHTSESEEESCDITCNVSGPTDCSCYCCSASSDSSSVPFLAPEAIFPEETRETDSGFSNISGSRSTVGWLIV